MSYSLINESKRTARKVHRCIWCGQGIAVGAAYVDERSKYDGDFQHHRWHPECQVAAHRYFRDEGENEFTPYDNERPTSQAPIAA